MEADIEIVISKCFPRTARFITEKQMEAWLEELCQEMLILYENGGNRYLEFVTWKKHNRIRANESKYPGPNDMGSHVIANENMCQQMQADENNCGYTRDTNNDTRQETRTSTRTAKIKYADFVSLTNDEYASLVAKLGNEEAVRRCIDILDNYKGANGKRYKSDYRAILNWVIDRYNQEQKPKTGIFGNKAGQAVGEGFQILGGG
jgi:hypothetical protein